MNGRAQTEAQPSFTCMCKNQSKNFHVQQIVIQFNQNYVNLTLYIVHTVITKHKGFMRFTGQILLTYVIFMQDSFTYSVILKIKVMGFLSFITAIYVITDQVTYVKLIKMGTSLVEINVQMRQLLDRQALRTNSKRSKFTKTQLIGSMHVICKENHFYWKKGG